MDWNLDCTGDEAMLHHGSVILFLVALVVLAACGDSQPARQAFEPAIPGNAFDDYLRACARVDQRASPDEVAELVARGAARERADDPHALELEPSPLRHWATARIVAKAADRARSAGDRSRAVRYELALLRYGQDLASGSLLRVALGQAIQRQAASALNPMLADPELQVSTRLRAVVSLRSLIASRPVASQIVRRAVDGDVRVAEHAPAATDRDRRTATRLAELVEHAAAEQIDAPGGAHRLCRQAGATPAHCRILAGLAITSAEVDRLLAEALALAGTIRV